MTLITSGPFRFPGIRFDWAGTFSSFFGAALLLGTPMGLLITALHLPLMDRFVRREEKQLSRPLLKNGCSIRRRCVDGFDV